MFGFLATFAHNRNKYHLQCHVLLFKALRLPLIQVETDQDFEIEVFAEYKYTLNELLVKKMFFSTSNSLRDMTNESFYRK